MVIAIDGLSACGKSTLAKAISRKLAHVYIDSGAMYRAVALYALQNELIKGGDIDVAAIVSHLKNIDIMFAINDKTGEYETYLNGECVEERIRQIDVSDAVSPISAIKEVRQKLIAMQQAIGKNGKVVMDGRDIGTNVFPNADIKIFVTASQEVRTQRRYAELQRKGMPVDWETVAKNIATRDHIDQNRQENPLRQADDAILLDNSNITQEEQLKWLEDLITSRTGQTSC
jgi:cytidylate kinase